MEADAIIIEPVLTEKTNLMREDETKKYVFHVNSRANKIMIMKAVEDLFNVKPMACNVMNVKPKPRTVRSRSGYRRGQTTGWKKAIVTLAPGDSIEIFEGA